MMISHNFSNMMELLLSQVLDEELVDDWIRKGPVSPGFTLVQVSSGRMISQLPNFQS